MKTILGLMKVLLLSSLLVSCRSREPASPPDEGKILATMVAATLTAYSSATRAPEPTAAFTAPPPAPSFESWSFVPSYVRAADVQFLFRVIYDTQQWEFREDQQSLYGVKRELQYLYHKQVPDCAFFRGGGAGLPSGCSAEKGQKTVGDIPYETAAVSRDGVLIYVTYGTDLSLGAYNLFFVGGSKECLRAAEDILASLEALAK